MTTPKAGSAPDCVGRFHLRSGLVPELDLTVMLPLLDQTSPLGRRRHAPIWIAAFAAATLALVLAGLAPTAAGAEEARTALAMQGEPAFAENLRFAPYVNPDAPKGGRLVEGVLGSFDSLNPFIVKGLAATGIRSPFVQGANVLSGYVVESLMTRGYDEP